MTTRELSDRLVTGRAAYTTVCIVFALLFVGALLLVWFGHTDLQKAGENTLTTSLVGFLITFLLDVNSRERARIERQHEIERAKLTQDLEHAFAVGSSSHMANVAFDKHVKFCEDYAAGLREAMKLLYTHVTTPKAIDAAAALYRLRHDQALWLTPEMEAPLMKIEQALRSLGAGQHRLETDGRLEEEEHFEINTRIHRLFSDLVGKEFLGPPPDGERYDDDLAIGNAVRGLGRVLGVDDLTHLRKQILRDAAKRARSEVGDSSRI